MTGFGSDGHVLLIVFSSFLLNKYCWMPLHCRSLQAAQSQRMLQEYPNKQVPFAGLLGDVTPIPLASCNYLPVLVAS